MPETSVPGVALEKNHGEHRAHGEEGGGRREEGKELERVIR
jgi:hypothetical protein